MRSDQNLVRTIRSTIRHNAAKPALLDGDRQFTWADFGARIAKLAGALNSAGVRCGGSFAILSRNGFRAEELKWAGFWLGAVPVLVNWRLAPTEIAQILEDADCVHVFAETPFAEALSHDALRAWSSKATVFGDASGPAAQLYESLLSDSNPAEPADPDPDDDAILIYTGGTTGRSKGVRLSHNNILSNALAFGLGVGARRDDVYMHAAPMFHSADLLALPWFLQGSPQCYLPAFSPQAFLQLIARHRVGAVITVPTMLIASVTHPAFKSADLSSLRTLIYGAAPMSLEWIDRVSAAFPDADFFNCYGLTETAPDLTIFDAKEFRAAIDDMRETGARSGPLLSVGKPNLLNEIRVIDGSGSEVAAGVTGEIVARGPNIMQGYLNLPEETSAAWKDGWFRTGDVGYIDDDGYVYLLDRLKDMVISGGENIYSTEVEAALNRHPDVAEVAVIGVPDEVLGETVMAAVVARSDTQPTREELSRHCREWIGGFKIPRQFVFVESLPKSALGKVLKASLRKQFSALPIHPEAQRSEPRNAA
jgi:long-chain acyl-CoA synthetase